MQRHVVARPKLSLQDIYQYLYQKNFNLSSDHILKNPQANADVIWNILVFLCINLKDTKYEQAEPTLIYLIDSQLHKNSLKKIKEYITISDVFKKILKIGEEYPIKEILRPEREIIHERLSLLIHANKFIEKVSRQYENQRTEIKLKKQLVQQLKKKLQMRLQEIEEVKAMKEKQKPQYEQKLVIIDSLNKDINYKKKQKLDLMNSQASLDLELKKKKKVADELDYTNEDLQLKIKQLERQVIKNAPKLKKERFALIDQYNNLLKENKDQFEIWDKKIATIQERLKPFYGLKEKSKTFRIEGIKKQLDRAEKELNGLSQSINRDEESRHQTINSKKETLKNIQKLEKEKKQLEQTIAIEERQMKLLEKSENIILQDQKKHKANVKVLEEKNQLSINQYKMLEDKIRHRSDKLKQKIFELNMRLKDLEEESKNIIQETFSQFN